MMAKIIGLCIYNYSHFWHTIKTAQRYVQCFSEKRHFYQKNFCFEIYHHLLFKIFSTSLCCSQLVGFGSKNHEQHPQRSLNFHQETTANIYVRWAAMQIGLFSRNTQPSLSLPTLANGQPHNVCKIVCAPSSCLTG